MRAFNGTARVLVDPWYKWWVVRQMFAIKDQDGTDYWTKASTAVVAQRMPSGLWLKSGTIDLDDDAPGKPPF